MRGPVTSGHRCLCLTSLGLWSPPLPVPRLPLPSSQLPPAKAIRLYHRFTWEVQHGQLASGAPCPLHPDRPAGPSQPQARASERPAGAVCSPSPSRPRALPSSLRPQHLSLTLLAVSGDARQGESKKSSQRASGAVAPGPWAPCARAVSAPRAPWSQSRRRGTCLLPRVKKCSYLTGRCAVRHDRERVQPAEGHAVRPLSAALMPRRDGRPPGFRSARSQPVGLRRPRELTVRLHLRVRCVCLKPGHTAWGQRSHTVEGPGLGPPHRPLSLPCPDGALPAPASRLLWKLPVLTSPVRKEWLSVVCQF